jgi:tetratricopeptide (TPR) repeat protein
MNHSQTSPPPAAPPKPIKDPAALLASIIRYADAHYAREDWLAARDFLSLAVQIDPCYPRLLGSLGSLQFQLQEYPAACSTFSAAVRQSPDNPDLHIQLAMVHLQLKQVGEAKAALQRSLSLRPNNPTARQMLGDLDFAAKRYGDAAQHYCALLESNPDGVNLLLHLGKCLYELRDLASARWCFERVIALEPSNAIASEALQILAASASSTSCPSAQ